MPASGSLTTTASGTGQPETAPDTPGTIDVKVGDFTADIQAYDANGGKGLLIPVTCALVPGQDTSLGSITVTPKVDTGIGADDSGNGLTQAGVGIAAVGVLAAGGAAVRRRRNNG